jgi:hypothetical protein
MTLLFRPENYEVSERDRVWQSKLVAAPPSGNWIYEIKNRWLARPPGANSHHSRK